MLSPRVIGVFLLWAVFCRSSASASVFYESALFVRDFFARLWSRRVVCTIIGFGKLFVLANFAGSSWELLQEVREVFSA